MSEIPNATDKDYVEIQGGKPRVTKKGKLKIVTHDYEGGDGLVVPSHKDHGTVIIDTSRGPRRFNVDELKSLHGDPCEKTSKRHGGDGYDRK